MALPDKRPSRAPDRAALARAVEDLLLACGAELDAETRATPERVAKAFADHLDGHSGSEQRGVAALCIGGGEATAVAVERVT